jgi:hypothetical protein
MMVRECTSTCYVLFWIVAVPASGPSNLRVLMKSGGLLEPNARSTVCRVLEK